MDIHFATSAHGWITQKRPWWAILVWLAGMLMLAHAVFQREKLGDWEDMNFLYAASTLAGLGPIIFLFLKVYGRSDFSPKMEQERETLSCKDPISQQHRFSSLEEGYPMIEEKNCLSIMQSMLLICLLCWQTSNLGYAVVYVYQMGKKCLLQNIHTDSHGVPRKTDRAKPAGFHPCTSSLLQTHKCSFEAGTTTCAGPHSGHPADEPAG